MACISLVLRASVILSGYCGLTQFSCAPIGWQKNYSSQCPSGPVPCLWGSHWEVKTTQRKAGTNGRIAAWACCMPQLRCWPWCLNLRGFWEAKGNYRHMGNRTNTLNAKMFTLHLRLRNAQIPPGKRRELTASYESKAEKVKWFSKICLHLLVQLLFPWGQDREFIFLLMQKYMLI